ncbi:MAG: ABC transporter permease subunit [Firmicutes bacterium]|nr:ABC transporter permease subunit [Bacillota bacterium]
MSKKTTSFFSGPLFKQTCKSNVILMVAVLIIMIMMANVTNYAGSIMGTEQKETLDENTMEDLFSYMFVLASYNTVSGSDLSYEDFLAGGDVSDYEKAFDLYNMKNKDEPELSVAGFENVVNKVEKGDIDPQTYISQFEYVYALAGEEGCFSGEELALDDFMEIMLESSGMSMDDLERMEDMDFTVFFNKIYFTVIGMLPPFIFVIIIAYMLIAGQVDKGSMAYILSTPTKRSAVAITQAAYMILAPLVLMLIVFAARCGSTVLFYDEVCVPRLLVLYLGMYLVAQAAAGICYMCSCVFNQGSKALGVGGGLTVWFFLAALLGMFGSEDLINMGIGVEILNIFNKLTIVSLFDAGAIQTIGTASVDTGFIPGLVILAVISVACYVIGAVKFCKKDLPL